MADIICEKMSCHTVCDISARTYRLGLYGLEEDAALALETVEYAVAFVREANRQMSRRLRRAGYSTKEISNRQYSFGAGFAAGLRKSYAEGDQEWGLVLQLPQEVRDYGDRFETVHMRKSRPLREAEWGCGYNAGNQYQTPAGALNS